MIKRKKLFVLNNLKIPCQKVNVGKYDGTASWEIFEYARNQNLIVDELVLKY